MTCLVRRNHTFDAEAGNSLPAFHREISKTIMPTPKAKPSNDRVGLYDKLIATNPEIER